MSYERNLIMRRPVLLDKNGVEVNVGNKVIFKGDLYDVGVNQFNSRVIIENELGEEYLEFVHTECEVVTA